MHMHLTNCHGEWTALAVILAHAPLVGLWVRSLLRGVILRPIPYNPTQETD